ncbi:MAG TPA: hypothetical protein VFE37_04650 [Chloroflexota bacterium]|nr:hypothetical protein [Chloroflexota bacterium]
MQALERLHQRLLDEAQSLLVTLERPPSAWAVRDDVQGHMLRLGPGRLTDADRAELCAQLRADIQALQALTGRLQQLAAALHAEGETDS